MSGAIFPLTPGVSCTKTSSYDDHITDKINMHPEIFPPTAICIATNTTNQDKSPSLSDIPDLQVGQDVTYIDSNGTRAPKIITKVMICSISGDPMYLIECTPNQYHTENIYSLHEPSYPDMFFINCTIRPLYTNTPPKTPATTIGFGLH